MKPTTTLFTRASTQGGLRLIGFLLAVVSVILPAFPLGMLAAPPWTPMACLWAAYGWAAEAVETEKIHRWRGVQAPLVLAGLGLVHDQFAGGPLGLYAILYVATFMIGGLASSSMRSPNFQSLWAGFIATCGGVWAVAAVVAPWALGGYAGLRPFATSCIVTALLFPLVRSLYMEKSTV
jgi:hypothetical protein